jgi:hypothetical protein
LLGFALAWILLGRRRPSRMMRVSLLTTVTATILLAVTLSGLHIPFVSGH